MEKILLSRVLENNSGTFGNIIYNDNIRWVSGERCWRDNMDNESCIPVGEYVAKWSYSPKRRMWLYELQSVKDRADIQIHVGNFPLENSLGCILIGYSFGYDGLHGQFVKDSKLAFREFNKVFAQKDIMVRIVA